MWLVFPDQAISLYQLDSLAATRGTKIAKIVTRKSWTVESEWIGFGNVENLLRQGRGSGLQFP